MSTTFTQEQVEAMCRQCGFTRQELHAALRRVGATALPKPQRARWSAARPTDQFCYRVTEAIVKSGRMPAGYQTMRRQDAEGSHYFFQHPESGAICDPTADQFLPVGMEQFQVPAHYDYSGGKAKKHLPQLSNGARAVMAALGWSPISEG